MPRMERDDERRAEQRLRYRWPVRFAAKAGEKPLSGQMFDVSSEGMAFLFHAHENCPRPEQSITANFGVPHFDSHGSFDTAFFNRLGRVCRVDNLTSRVNRIAVQFAEPLFFKPGEQDISEPDAQQRLQAKARSVVASKDKDENYAEALVGAEEEARRKAKLYEEQIAKVKAEAAGEIARIGAETAYKVAEAKAEVRANLHEQSKAREKDNKSTKEHAQKPPKGSLVKKMDDFITDRNKIY